MLKGLLFGTVFEVQDPSRGCSPSKSDDPSDSTTGPASDSALLSLLSPSSDEQKVEIALKLLSTRAEPEMLFPVLGLLEHDSPSVRRRAVELLARIADARAMDYLIAHLGDADASVDTAAVDALASLARRHPEQKEPLQRKISRAAAAPDPLTRANALSLLFEIGSEDYFREYNVFDRYKIDSQDSLSLKFFAVKIFQEMLAFHANDKDPAALINDDVERLRFIKQAQSLGLSLDEIKALLPGLKAGLEECRRVRERVFQGERRPVHRTGARPVANRKCSPHAYCFPDHGHRGAAPLVVG